jgi:hypothetical protein
VPGDWRGQLMRPGFGHSSQYALHHTNRAYCNVGKIQRFIVKTIPRDTLQVEYS